jgi:hypothetical protein
MISASEKRAGKGFVLVTEKGNGNRKVFRGKRPGNRGEASWGAKLLRLRPDGTRAAKFTAGWIMVS